MPEIACPQSAAGCRHPAPTCQHGCRNAADELTRLGQEMEASMPEPTPTPMVGVQGKCPSCGKTSLFLSDGGYVTCARLECPEPDAASTVLERQPARCAPTPAPFTGERPAGRVKARVSPWSILGAAPVPLPADVRDQIAETLAALDCSKWERPVPDKSHEFWRIWQAQADAVLRVPAIAEALTEAAELARKADGWRGQAFRSSQALAEALATVERVRELAKYYLHDSDDGIDPCAAAVLAALDPQEQP